MERNRQGTELRMADLGGYYAALPTPFTSDGSKVADKPLGELVEGNLRAGLTGLYVGGSTGEAFLMSPDEREHVFRIVAKAAEGKATLIAHVGDTNPQVSARLAGVAAEIGYQAISAVPPFYYRYGMEEIAAHYAWLSGQTGLPFLIYNFPDLSGVHWSVSDLSRLLDIPGIVGVKNTCGDLRAFEALRRSAPERVLLHGFDETLLAGLSLGADGGIGSTYNVQAHRILQLAEAHRNGEMERARALQAEANGLIDAIISVGVIPALKHLIERGGIAMGNCRPPFRPLSDLDRRRLDAAAERHLIGQSNNGPRRTAKALKPHPVERPNARQAGQPTVLTGPEDIRGVWATILCRVDESGAPDLSAIDEQVAVFARAGCDGVYSGGTASESHCQSEAQFKAISTRFAEVARSHGLPFQIGAAHPLAQGSLARVAFAATLAPGAIQVTLPDWTRLDLPGAQRYLDGVAEAAAGVPLVLYNPPHARTTLEPDALQTIARATPALVGLKCGGGDAAWYRAMAPVLDRLSVFIPGHNYASGTTQGAHGSYSNVACLSPSGATRWAQLPAAQAHDLEGRIADFFAEAVKPIMERGLPGFACDKAMAAAGGWARIGPRLMWPYSGATDAEVARIRDAASRHIPAFLETACL